ncbi:uncharacterized protein B0I36DRAFT_77217 [Microdochium trichocladiopsis]|uniref:Uncharacterized protein n=1 Tax=Microdochium trichocladiopsis TaxID=1682393 RepID=A0A9P9BV85_9PEZI|nr:uncharacterized protein B0I36DRAFT_77217 [Microdochium trichocladiopsis]KAH7038234.1 hypothetical protein B0I36DRAFT_77217 [Microdochium trichocladiopsis]
MRCRDAKGLSWAILDDGFSTLKDALPAWQSGTRLVILSTHPRARHQCRNGASVGQDHEGRGSTGTCNEWSMIMAPTSLRAVPQRKVAIAPAARQHSGDDEEPPSLWGLAAAGLLRRRLASVQQAVSVVISTSLEDMDLALPFRHGVPWSHAAIGALLVHLVAVGSAAMLSRSVML